MSHTPRRRCAAVKDRQHHVFDWNVPGSLGGQPLAIRGSLDYRPPPQSSFNPILIAPVLALALAGGIFWWARRRRSISQ